GFFISKQTLDTILRQKHKHVADMIALLSFYHYTALWQRTNQVWVSLEYAAKGLHWGRDKVRIVRSLLLKLGFVEEIRATDADSGLVTGWYLRLPFFHPTENQHLGSPPAGFTTSGEIRHKCLRSFSVNA